MTSELIWGSINASDLRKNLRDFADAERGGGQKAQHSVDVIYG